MKKFFCILILVCMLIPSFTSCAKNAHYEDALTLLENGEYAKAYSYLEELGDHEEAQELLTHFYFIPTEYFVNGKLVCEITLGENGLPAQKVNHGSQNLVTAYTYDQNGNILKTVQGENTEDYIYDENGRLIKKVSVYSYGTFETAYVYDEKGYLKEEISYDQNGKTGTIRYTYDERGNCIRYALSDTYVWTYTYDDENKMIHATGPDFFSSGETQNDYSYDQKGNLIQAVSRTADGETTTYDYEYDSDGNPIKIVCTTPDGKTETKEYSYRIVYIEFDLSEEAEEFILGLIDS